MRSRISRLRSDGRGGRRGGAVFFFFFFFFSFLPLARGPPSSKYFGATRRCRRTFYTQHSSLFIGACLPFFTSRSRLKARSSLPRSIPFRVFTSLMLLYKKYFFSSALCRRQRRREGDSRKTPTPHSSLPFARSLYLACIALPVSFKF